MTRRRVNKSSPTVQTVQAVFDPAGDIRVRATAPSGKVYELVPRVPFEIEKEDADWFFSEWDWEHRQCLSRAVDYHPRKAQFDNGVAQLEKDESPALSQQFDNGANQLEKKESPAPEPDSDPLEALLIDVNEEGEGEFEPVSSTESEDKE